MVETREKTAVVIVGAGVAGLTLGNLLRRNGIGCVILEKHSRAYAEGRQRAGTIDSRGVRMFRDTRTSTAMPGSASRPRRRRIRRAWRSTPGASPD